MSQNNEITFYDRIENPMEAIEKLGTYITKSGIFSCDRMEQGMMMAMACLAEKKSPLEIARTYHIVNGTLTKKYEVMLGEFYQSGGKVEWIERSDKAIEAKFTNKNGTIQQRMTMDDLVDKGVAMNKGKMKDTYKTYPRQMLTARLVSEVINLLEPSITSGVYTPEEVSDFKQPNSTNNSNKSNEPLLKKQEDVVVEAVVVESEPEIAPLESVPDVSIDSEGDYTADQQKVLKQNATAVNNFLRKIEWVSESETFEDLNAVHKKEVIERFDAFVMKAKIENGG